MKFGLEPQDVEEIAQRVVALLSPMLRENGEGSEKDTIFGVNGLAEYLHVDPSWVYKQVSLRAIPCFKAGKYPRFRKKDIDKWIESQTARPVPPLKLVKNRGVTT